MKGFPESRQCSDLSGVLGMKPHFPTSPQLLIHLEDPEFPLPVKLVCIQSLNTALYMCIDTILARRSVNLRNCVPQEGIQSWGLVKTLCFVQHHAGPSLQLWVHPQPTQAPK